MEAENLYDILGVEKTASPAAIQRAYRALALRFHPDRNQRDQHAAAVRFARVATAYDTLKDPDKRALYDRGFRPVHSLGDLLASTVGQRFMDSMLPSAPAEKRDGHNTIVAAEISAEMLKKGGIVSIPNPHDPKKPLVISFEPGYVWMKVRGLGGKGKNGGENGSLHIRFVTTETKKR
jgi:DnaJ-class molecular chaperone